MYPDASFSSRWIGVDLNTTGYAVVVADPVSRKVLKLGKKNRSSPVNISINCTKLYHEGKLWKLKKQKTRERKNFKTSLNKIAQQIVSFADASCAGIKFENLFTSRYRQYREDEGSYEFSFENGSFLSLLHLVEKRALRRGIPILYIDPSNTSKRCSRCGGFGRRYRKQFECPHCGYRIHADVNAAFNIASIRTDSDRAEVHRLRTLRKKMRRLAREQLITGQQEPATAEFVFSRDMLAPWNEQGTLPAVM
jgi:putative transposase